MRRSSTLAAFSAALLLAACTGLGALQAAIQPPRFASADGHPATLNVVPPSGAHPTGGLSVRLWARIDNPNPFALTLASLAGNLYLEDRRAADVSFPLGLPLPAAADTVIPLDITVSFSDLPTLRDVALRAASGRAVAYRLDGRFAVDAGLLGEQSFGPMQLLQGSVSTNR